MMTIFGEARTDRLSLGKEGDRRAKGKDLKRTDVKVRLMGYEKLRQRRKDSSSATDSEVLEKSDSSWCR